MVNSRLLHLLRLRRSFLGKQPRRRRRLPVQVPPNAVVLFYRTALLAYVAEAQALLRQRLLPLLPGLIAEARRERGDAVRTDAGGKRAKEVMDEVRAALEKQRPTRELEALAETVANRTSSHEREQLNRQLRAAVGVDVLAAEPNLTPMVDNFVQQNVSLIKSIPQRLFGEVEQTVQQAVTAGWRHEDLAKSIEERFDVSESRAELIARDQTLKFYGSLNEVRQKALGLTHYTWRTSRDERVRATHEEREGKRYSWEDSDIIPGEEVNCRCSAEPDVDALLESL